VRGPGGSNSAAAAVAHARIGQQYRRGTPGGGGGKLASALGLAPRRRRQLFLQRYTRLFYWGGSYDMDTIICTNNIIPICAR